MGLVSRYVGPQTFLDYLQGCIKPLAQRPMGSMPFSLLLGQEVWAESGKWEGLMFPRISCCLMSDESGHTHKQAPSRFLVGGKKLGQGSGDKLGEHPFPPPLLALSSREARWKARLNFIKAPWASCVTRTGKDRRRCWDCGLSRPVLPGVSRKAD